ncbi:serine hydrolase domain-containing protein [Streptomyces antarcticus]|uniref:serine hydrolase domain-containing protein n=1 Tax=Streptomyces antarcticus TaxID=2996458 RepID=UPI00227220FB|nr:MULTISPECIES: serine hydrolase domain-containing protein [unclassified Streptomyces]MCY0942928.1 serine hydrolase [Streptomyces sp. H34-AA3]MCY0953025.1 serine hydrolase [Streptomyces sp. H27-S2]MCZ4083112.1 serine hydrolase [Streptomyces sp. H34-S5]
MSDIQKLVQDALDELVESGTETGLQAAVYVDGELAADAVAGLADPESGRPVTSDTPFWSASTGKGVTSTVVHTLVEKGLFGYDTRIVELWPEFGVHGKEGATIRHALTHSAGVPGLPADITPEDLTDWDKMAGIVASAEPWWEPGTQTGYHSVTFGWLLGEVVRRATGKPISQVLREEVAAPLGLENELFLGVPEAELGRLAKLDDAPIDPNAFGDLPEDFPLFKTAPPAIMPSAAYGNRADILVSDIPAGGTMTARSLAKMYAALLGEVDGVRLVSQARLEEITALAVDDLDQVVFAPSPKALGYFLGRPGSDPQQSLTVFGAQGMGGSAAYGDTRTKVSFALTKNRFNPTEASAVERVGGIVAKAVSGS